MWAAFNYVLDNARISEVLELHSRQFGVTLSAVFGVLELHSRQFGVTLSAVWSYTLRSFGVTLSEVIA